MGSHQNHHRNSNGGSEYTDVASQSAKSDVARKTRAHSIHVSIPTSEKQIQDQPQPFAEFVAEIERLRNANSNSHSHSSSNVSKRERLMRKPKMNQSIPVPVSG